MIDIGPLPPSSSDLPLHRLSDPLTDPMGSTSPLDAVFCIVLVLGFLAHSIRLFPERGSEIEAPMRLVGTAPALVDSRGVVVQAASAGWFIVSNSIGVMRPSPR